MPSENVSVIIPVYNEESGILPLMEGIESQGLFDRYEFILVNDGCTDRTCDIARTYPIRILNHTVNKGYGASLKTGIRAASGQKVIILDGDGQHCAKSIAPIISMLETHDMVIGQRTGESFREVHRDIGKQLIRWVGEFLVEQKLPDFNSGYRGFNKKIIHSMLHMMPNGFSFSTTSTLAFLKEGYSVGTLDIETGKRTGRKSSVSFFRDGAKTLLLIMRLIMLFNPLKIFFPAAGFFSIGGLLFGIWSIIFDNRLANSAVVIMILGMLLFFFGLLADQVAMLNRKSLEKNQ